MAFDSFLIELDGDEATDVYNDVLALEVELADDHPATCRLKIGSARGRDGIWSYMDEERFRPWTPIDVEVGFTESGRHPLFSGYVTEAKAAFDPDPSKCALELVSTDAGVLLDREEKLRDWPGKRDSEIAEEIFREHGLTPDVERTDVVHEEEMSTVIQRETDCQLLKRLALRNGMGCFVENGTGHFRSLPVEESPQPVLAAHFGEECNLMSFSATMDALRPSRVSMFQVDRFAKEVLSTAAESAEGRPMGAMGPDGLRGSGVPAGQVYVGKNAATGVPEMDALCRGLFEEGARFVQAEGRIDSGAYGHVLRPRRPVTVKGVGATHSGVYYVSYVRHELTCRSYEQHFRAERDAVLPRGDEDFASAGSPRGLA